MPRFKTIKSVEQVIGAFRFYEEALERRIGSNSRLLPIYHAHSELWVVCARNLATWSRNQRKQTGTPGKVDDYLLEHAADIREILRKLETAVANLDRDYYTGEERSVFDRAYAALDALWALDLDESEAHEIARTARTRPEPGTLRHWMSVATLAEKDEMITQLLDILIKDLGKQQAQEAVAPKPQPTPAPLPDAADLLSALDAALAGEGLEVAGD